MARQFTHILLSLLMIAGLTTACHSADLKKKKSKKKNYSIRFDSDRMDFEGLDELLKDYEEVFEDLVEEEMYLDRELAQVRHLHRIEPMILEIPDIDIDIPEIDFALAEIEPIHIDIPGFEFNIPHFEFEHDFDWDNADNHRFHMQFDSDNDSWGHPHDRKVSAMYRDMNEDDEIRLHALKSIARQDADTAIPALKKAALKDESAAIRYEAVRRLGSFSDDKRAVKILGRVIEKDSNLEIRKKAIHLLSRSDHPEAIEILENILKN